MPNATDVRWFKQQFASKIDAAIRGTPLSVDLIAAIACQETGYIWQVTRKKALGLAQILELCVGDTLDSDRGRSAFPKTKADLVARQNGQAMFEIARRALEDMSQHIAGYRGAVGHPDKFCHGYGIFQYDLQFFLDDPDFFLGKRYADFDACLAKCLNELKRGLRKLGLENNQTLSDFQMAALGIVYNAGRFDPQRGLKQGHQDDGKYYGEAIFDFIRLSKTVAAPDDDSASMPEPEPGTSTLPPPTPISATGAFYEVDVRDQPLRLRREPAIDPDDPSANVITRLPDGLIARAVNDQVVNGFREVETSLAGAHYRGFASAQFLKPAPDVADVPIVTPAATPPDAGIIAVYLKNNDGTITRRFERAGAYSLNEASQPGRTGTTPDDLRRELAAIIEWLAADDPAHLRYAKHDGLTFCNIYAHDYCYLADVYLPRVWWTPGAIEALTRGEKIRPRYNATIEEARANDLFRWLRDFGPRFGWRQTGTASKLQLEVNQGAIGLIVARRKEDGPPGHIVVVVPETEENRAQRNDIGEVIAPLSSQAGSINFRYGLGRPGWWNSERFAESAMWLHG
ncbi:MAG: hypothetical protein Q7S58_03945 [Candidatus Binatus sp.]|uniref:hypothetical protein n=1 Tax=Candidatus Binatus sp. TaxID=2811406 RepID=UPI0027191BB3|nr:hypothetical protein [Candidatus Binatus sp.]MDO8431543.1 hypothetical protein [Candidatus Binatus sp.]